MKSSNTQEYTDEKTGTRMTIERDGSAHPRITIFPPEPCTLEIEEIGELIRRLLEVLQEQQNEDEISGK